MPQRITRRDLLRQAFGTAAAVGAAGTIGCSKLMPETSPSPGKRPNILFIMVDEMRWDVMGCEGHPTVKSPHLDQLAQEGTRFANAYSVAPVCTPARWSAFTGRYSHVHGVTSNGSAPKDGELLLPSIMRHYGYTTAISGKLHYLPKEPDYGFDYFWSYSGEGPRKLETYSDYMKAMHGSPNTHAVVPGSCPYPNDPVGGDLGKFPYKKEDFMSYWITARSIDFLKEQKDAEKPWFLFTSYLIPHSPYRAPEPYYSMYPPDSFDVPAILPGMKEKREKIIASGNGGSARHMVDNEDLLRLLTAQYFGHVTNVDDNVGMLIAELKRLGLYENTIIVFTADHGNMLGDKGKFFKGVMYEGSSHIPLLVRVPPGAKTAKGFNGGKVRDELIEITDIMPTLMDLADLPVPDNGIQGRSFKNLAMGKDKKWKNVAYAQRGSSMVRTPEFKLIIDDRGKETPRYELYNMRKDPKESTNLAKDAAHENVVNDLAEMYRAWQEDQPAPTQIPGMQLPDYAVLTADQRANIEKGKKAQKKLRDEKFDMSKKPKKAPDSEQTGR